MRWFAVGALLLSGWVLSGCDEDDILEKAEKAISGGNAYTKLQFVNVSQVPLDFHVAPFGSGGQQPTITDGHYRVVSLESLQTPAVSHVRRFYGDERLVVQAFDRQTGKASEYLQLKAALDKPLHVVAWTYQQQVRLTVWRRETSSINGSYRLRVLSVADAVQLVAAGKPLALKAGEVSDWLSLANCAGEFVLNNKPVDICQATAGLSFVVIVNDHKVLALVPAS